MVNNGWEPLASLATPANLNGFRVLAALLHGTPTVGVSQTLRRWTEGAAYIRQGGHHVGHWPTFLVLSSSFSSTNLSGRRLDVYNIDVLTIGKKIKQQYLLHMFWQYGELRPTNGWDLLASFGHPSWFQWVSRLGSVTARHSGSGRQPNCGVEQRAPPIFGRAPITLGIGPHST